MILAVTPAVTCLYLEPRRLLVSFEACRRPYRGRPDRHWNVRVTELAILGEMYLRSSVNDLSYRAAPQRNQRRTRVFACGVLVLAVGLPISVMGCDSVRVACSSVTYARGKADPTTRATYYDIYSRSAEGCTERQLTNTPGLSNTGPRLSPDGSRLVFSSVRDGDAEIFVMNAADGAALQQVTHNSLPDVEPDWASDGSNRIIFASLRNRVFGLYLIDVYGGNEHQLTIQGDRQPDWSTQGKIAFVSERGGQRRVFIMDSDGGNQVAVTTSGNYRQPVWSNDGQELAYGNAAGLWIDDAPGSHGTPRQIFTGPAEAHAWSPDGRWLEAAKFENQQHTVFRVEVDSHGQATEFVTGTDPIIDLEWSSH